MGWHENTQFRITTWPEVRLPQPPPNGGVLTRFDERAAAFAPEFGDRLLPVPASNGETYLILAALDPDDVTAIASFITNYGSLGVRGQYTPSFSLWEPLLVGHDETSELEAALVHAAGTIPEPYLGETLVEFHWAITLMRDMVAAWRALRGELDPRSHQWECPLWRYRQNPLDSPPWEDEGPTSLLGQAFDSGLRPFSPHVRTFRVGEEPATLFAGESPTWHVCCLELFNHIVEEADYKVCANEPCGRLFVRQQGRAEHGQHRSKGVKYCTSECARAQAQRAYRRRTRRPD